MTVAILGAGIAGIGAGLALAEGRRDVVLLELEDGPGGLVRTDDVAGFAFDRTGHFLHFKGDLLSERIKGAGVPLECIARDSAVLVGGTLVPYPIQYNLWALAPSRLVRDALAELTGAGEQADSPETLADLLLSSWGPTLYEVFFRPYNEKLWGRPLTELPADCVGAYLPTTDLELAAAGAVGPTAYGGYNGTFFYPTSGRLGDAADALAAPLEGQARYGCAVRAIDLRERLVETESGETVEYERLISTLPLDDLLARAGEWPAPDLFEAAAIVNVRVGFRGAVRVPHQWVYVADDELPFHRIGFPGNVNGRTCPAGCASISVEYTCPRVGRSLAGEAIAGWALDYLDDLGLVELDELLTVTEHLLSPAYVVHRSPGRPELEGFRDLLAAGGVDLAGRFGTWDYLSIEESFESGWRAGAALREVTRAV